MTPAWYAIMTASSAGFVEGRRAFGEFAAVERIGDEGFEAFCPTLRVLERANRHAARRNPKYFPMYPGYCFARFDAGVPISRIERWREVIDVVRMGDEPARIKPAQIEALRKLDGYDAAVDRSGKPADTTTAPIVRVGDRAEHRGGAWEGVELVVEQVHKDKATVRVLFLGVPRRVQVPIAELEAIRRALSA